MRRNVSWEVENGKDTGSCTLWFAPCMPEPERIVALGFRYWMIGMSTGDIGAWERAWCLYSGLFGATGAKQAVGCLSRWVGSVTAASGRDIEVFPMGCRSFSRDECIAVSMIAACQHDTNAAARTSAFALVDATSIDAVLSCAREFANTLSMLDHRLSADTMVVTTHCTEPASVTLQ